MQLPSTMKKIDEWVILGPMGPALPEKLNQMPQLGVDGGAHFSNRLLVWVGDADSFNQEVKAEAIFKVPTEKHESDFALALGLFKDPRHYLFHLWGFLGGRGDHELFNLGEAFHFLEDHPESQLHFYNHQGLISYMVLGAGNWKFYHHGLFSIGTLKKTSLKMTGQCRYPLTSFHAIRPLTSQGLSNVAEGEVTIENEGPIFIYFPEGK
jgi:thiamine pyrophosphokinase